MYKLLLFFALLMMSIFGTAQELPDPSPKSPEAAAFLKYGDYPVNLSTGVPNIGIPIYTIESGGYSLPISLNYHASGIKVNQEASWVGLGWNLSAGAQIILDVRDEPDEYNPAIDNMPVVNDVIAYMQNNPNGYYDSYFNTMKAESWVKDVYNFTSPTASGKFIIDNFSTKQISVFPPEAFKVELTGSRTAKRFTITDKMGNKYVFDSTREYSQTLQQYQPPLYTSAWFVDEIETPTGDLITFNYHDAGGILQKSYSDSAIKTTIYDPLALCRNTANPNQLPGNEYEKTEVLSTIQLNNISNLNTETRKIKEIIFNGGRVSFEIDRGRQDLVVPSELSNNAVPGKLNFIKVQAKNLNTNTYTTIKNFAFNYSYFTAASSTNLPNRYRLRLDKLDDMIGIKETKFVYSDIQLPVKDSKSQDYWGYYNGKSNTDMIPKQYIYVKANDDAPNILKQLGTADRKVNPETIEAGMLKEIIHPTKGITKFGYEPNMYYGSNIFDEYSIVSRKLYGEGDGSILEATYVPGPNGDVCSGTNIYNESSTCIIEESAFFNPAITSKTTLTYKITDSSGDPETYKYQKGKITVLKNGVEIYSTNARSNTHVTVDLGYISGIHELKLEAYGSYIKVDATIEYPEPATQKNLYASGLRIKDISNYDYNNSIISRKVYEYNLSTDNTKSSGVLTRDSHATFKSKEFVSYSNSNCIRFNIFGVMIGVYNDWKKTTTETYSSSSFNGAEQSSVTYQNVKERNIGSNGSNGYSLYTFKTDADYWQDTRGVIKINYGYKRGKMLSQEVFNEAGFIVRKTENTFVDDSRKRGFNNGFKLFQNYSISGSITSPPGMPKPLDQIFEIHGYSYGIDWFYQNQTKTTDYFYNASNVLQETVETTTDYIYDNPNHLQLTKTKTTKSDGNSIINKTLYPDDVSSTSALGNDVLSSTEKSAIDRLKANDLHHIGEAIQTSTYEDLDDDGIADANELLSVQRTNYKDWGNNIVLPKDIQTLKGVYNSSTNTLEDRVVFNDYYANGNIKEVQKKDGNTSVYIWGYNEQYPIAKIENATYTQVSSQVANLQSKSNLDDDHCLDSENCDEKNLRTALTSLRNSLPNAMVTTYTYDPLIGITSMTDPSGYTSYYVYDGFNRLRYIKNKDGEVQAENKYHYKLDDILATTTASSTSVNSGDTVTLTTNASGGTGNFAYKWTVSNGNLNQVFNTSVGTLNITTTASHTPSFSVTCEVTDTTINESVSTVTQIDVSSGPPPLSVNGITVSPTGLDNKSVGQNVTYSVTASGGSGNYSYVWKKTNSQSTVTYPGTTSSSKTIQVSSSDCFAYTITCTVTDTTTNEVVSKLVSIIVDSGCSGGPGL